VPHDAREARAWEERVRAEAPAGPGVGTTGDARQGQALDPLEQPINDPRMSTLNRRVAAHIEGDSAAQLMA